MELATNGFLKGLQMDTSPLVQGNDTLTDALNATFVTMNGNEVVLLNDMGNRRVSEAYLPAGYMPVGIKEYGGIIYIASYNPITGRGLVGSFPSPLLKANAIDDGENKGKIWKPSGFIQAEEYRGISGFLKERLNIIQLTTESLHSGDKFSIYCPEFWEKENNSPYYWGELYINNFNGTSTNKFFTLSIGVELNGFIDITDQLARWDGSTLLDPSEKVKGYFIASGLPNIGTVPTTDIEFLQFRLALPVNTYACKTAGPLFLKTVLNTILDFDYNLRIWSDLNLNLTFTIDVKFVADCPLGQQTNSIRKVKRTLFETRYANIVTSLPIGNVEGIYIVMNKNLSSESFSIYEKTNNEWSLLEDKTERFKINSFPAGFSSTPISALGFISHISDIPNPSEGDTYVIADENLKASSRQIAKYENSNWTLTTLDDLSVCTVHGLNYVLIYLDHEHRWIETNSAESGNWRISYSDSKFYNGSTEEAWTPTEGDGVVIDDYLYTYSSGHWYLSDYSNNYTISWDNGKYVFSLLSSYEGSLRKIIVLNRSLPLFDFKIKKLNEWKDVSFTISDPQINGNEYTYTATGTISGQSSAFEYAILPKTGILTFLPNSPIYYLKEFSHFGKINPIEVRNNAFKVTGWNYYFDNNILEVKGNVDSYPEPNEIRSGMKFKFIDEESNSWEYTTNELKIDFKINISNNLFFSARKIYKVEIYYLTNKEISGQSLVLGKIIEGENEIDYDWWVITTPVFNKLQEKNDITDICALYKSYKRNNGTLTYLESELKDALTIKPKVDISTNEGNNTITVEHETNDDFGHVNLFPYSKSNKPFKEEYLYTIIDRTNFTSSLDWNESNYPESVHLTAALLSDDILYLKDTDIQNAFVLNNVDYKNYFKGKISRTDGGDNRIYKIPYGAIWTTRELNISLYICNLFEEILIEAINNLKAPYVSYGLDEEEVYLVYNQKNFNDNSDWKQLRGKDVVNKSSYLDNHYYSSDEIINYLSNKGNTNFCVAGIDANVSLIPWLEKTGSEYYSLSRTNPNYATAIIWIKLEEDRYGILYIGSQENLSLNELKTKAHDFLNGNTTLNYGFTSPYASLNYGRPSNIDYYFSFYNVSENHKIFSVNDKSEISYGELKHTCTFTYEISSFSNDSFGSSLVEFELESLTINSETAEVFPFKDLDTSICANAILNFEQLKEPTCVIKVGNDYVFNDSNNNLITRDKIYRLSNGKYYPTDVNTSITSCKIGNKSVILPIHKVYHHVIGFKETSLRVATPLENNYEIEINNNNLVIGLPFLQHIYADGFDPVECYNPFLDISYPILLLENDGTSIN